MKTVFPVGTTIYKPEACSPGYNLISGAGIVKLVSMNGAVVHRWNVDPQMRKGFIHRVRMLANGRIMLLFGPGTMAGHVAEFDWDGTETWSYTPERFAHHDFWPTDRGTVYLICETRLPHEYLEKITDPARRHVEVFGDALFEVDRDKRIVWRWLQHEHMDVNRCNPIPANQAWMGGPDSNTITDWTHTNTIQELPENRWFDAGDARFKPGNILQSMRQLDTISIVDKDSSEVVWSYSGDYNGGLSGQHEPHMIEKGLPGAGNIIIFDNGASPQKDLAHCGCSYVLEINPSDNSLVWVYDKGHFFFARFTANCQRLPNGNTLILESLCKRLFEVTPDKEIVWEYILTDSAQRVYRYPYDYCAAFNLLPAPIERSVTPPSEFRIEPD
ncbi:MAG: arylsulfotransferase family protein [Lentisphaeria bacterium]|nr:arylsulfotransferase family protein [Lentisphaeria bacterium]